MRGKARSKCVDRVELCEGCLCLRWKWVCFLNDLKQHRENLLLLVHSFLEDVNQLEDRLSSRMVDY